MPMSNEDLADLIRATNGNLSRRMEEIHVETSGAVMTLRNDVMDVRRSLDLRGTVAAMAERIEALEGEMEALKRAG